MLVATLDQERKSIYKAGLKEDREEGLAQGVKAQQETLLRLVHWRFQPSEAEAKELARILSQVDDLLQLNRLIDTLLQAMNLLEFSAQVERLASAIDSGHRPS